MANVDSEGIARARAKETDNQHSGRGQMGFTRKAGTKGTGRTKGNGTGGGGINRSLRSHPQH